MIRLFRKPQPRPREIVIGAGLVRVAHGVKDGRRFVIIMPCEKAGEVGSQVAEPGLYAAREQDTIIWLDTAAGAGVLMGAIHRAAHQ